MNAVGVLVSERLDPIRREMPIGGEDEESVSSFSGLLFGGADMTYRASDGNLTIELGPEIDSTSGKTGAYYPRGVTMTVPVTGTRFSNLGEFTEVVPVSVPGHSFAAGYDGYVTGGFHGLGAVDVVGEYYFDNYSTIGGVGAFGGSLE